MKLQTLLSASVLAILLTLNAGVRAEEKAPADGQTPRATETKTDKAQPGLQPHSHVQEKTGGAPRVQSSDAGKKSPASDMSRHFHPRDGK